MTTSLKKKERPKIKPKPSSLNTSLGKNTAAKSRNNTSATKPADSKSTPVNATKVKATNSRAKPVKTSGSSRSSNASKSGSAKRAMPAPARTSAKTRSPNSRNPVDTGTRTASRQPYQAGSAALKLDSNKKTVAKTKKKVQEKPKVNPKNRANQKNATVKVRLQRTNHLHFLYTVISSSIIGLFVFLCFQYLNLQANVIASSNDISRLQAKLDNLKAVNDDMELNINSKINYDEVLESAINDLGMVYPDKSQVIIYDTGESEYVQQLKDIPTE